MDPPWIQNEAAKEAARRQEEILARLRNDLKNNRLAIITGAGVTLNVTADTSGKPLSRITWTGLMRNGLDYLVNEGYMDRSNRRTSRAYEALEDPEIDGLLDAANILSSQMKQQGQFPTWLESVFGSLSQETRHPDLLDMLKALHERGATLLTTNYDDVLEKYCGLQRVGRSNQDDVSRFQRGDLNGVFHIHGSYHDAHEVVLDTTDYYDVKNSDGVQDVLKTFLQYKTILFIGCGSGLEDPNFDALLRWASQRHKNIPHRHCLLIRDDDSVKYQPLIRVKYGPKYEDLVVYLKRLLDNQTEVSDIVTLTTDTAHDIKNIKLSVERLCDSLDGESRENILKWLVTTDPSPNHNVACELHDAHTGNWLMRTSEYEGWKTGSTRFLWLHGIPGAGKTVLLSHIAKNVKEHCRSFGSDDITCSYYYCYFGRAQDEAPHLLRWVVNQLCRQCKYVPNELRECFLVKEQPSIQILTSALSAVLRNFRKVYLIIDALDESLDKGNLLRLLVQFAGDGFERIKLLATSRKEVDIEKALGNISTVVSLSIPQVDEDILVYIQNQLRDHHNLRAWPESLWVEIEEALVKGAQGMFRWAACQIDILGRLHSTEEIYKALSDLPETLDETYERILMKIPVKKRGIAHKALQLLAFHREIFSDLNQLAEAVIVDVEKLSFKTESRFLDRNALFEICTCLITHEFDDEVRLAHYSVKEYLVSERIQQSTAREFYISKAAADILVAKTALVYLLDTTYEGVPRAKDYFWHWEQQQQSEYDDLESVAFPLRSTALGWHYFIQELEDSVDKALIDGLIVRLLSAQGAHYNGWLERAEVDFSNYGGGYFPRWRARPGIESNLALAYACFFKAFGAAEVLLRRSPDLATSGERLELDLAVEDIHTDAELCPKGTLIEVAIVMRVEPFIKLLLDRGADANGVDLHGRTRLLSALDNVYDEFGSTRQGDCFGSVRLLLCAGADPNPRGVAKTPLQVAAKNHNCHVAKLLLDAGAHVNAVADDEAVVVKIRQWYTQAQSEEDLYIQQEIDEGIRERGKGDSYLTPLRIVETRSNYETRGTRKYNDLEQESADVKQLLIERGGKSLSLFPVKDLPGYMEADIKSISRDRTDEAVLIENNSRDEVSPIDEIKSSDAKGTFHNIGTLEQPTQVLGKRSHDQELEQAEREIRALGMEKYCSVLHL